MRRSLCILRSLSLGAIAGAMWCTPWQVADAADIHVPADHASIQDAIDAASTGDVIHIAAGVYTPEATIDLRGKQIVVRGAVDAEGLPAATIDGQWTKRLFVCNSGETTATALENLTIINGRAARGGAIFIEGSEVTVRNCTFIGNEAVILPGENAQFEGGAICVWSTGWGCDIFDSRFIDNTAAYSGGALAGRVNLSDCVFIENSASSAATTRGGAIYGWGNTMVRCRFERNWAQIGGGISGWFGVMEDCEFIECAASDGGAMNVYTGSSPMTARRMTFEACTASFGGALSISGIFTFEDCAFRSCSATWGGAIYQWGAPKYQNLRLQGSTFCGNSASLYGAQITSRWTDLGGNCLVHSCSDADDDGVPDTCASVGDGLHVVPDEYPTVEAAVSAAGVGDTVLIRAGVYEVAQPIDMMGKRLVIRGEVSANGSPATILDGGNQRMAARATTQESADCVWENIVFRRGDTNYGAMFFLAAQPTLRNCRFTENVGVAVAADTWGAPTLKPTFEDVTFCRNGLGTGAQPQISGIAWIDAGVCFANSCADADNDGTVDQCVTDPTQVVQVPRDVATIDEAIAVVRPGGTIELAAGTFAPTTLLRSGGVGFTMRGAVDAEGRPATFIDGLGQRSLLSCTGAHSAPLTFENLVFTKARGALSAVYAFDVDVEFRNCRFENNEKPTDSGPAAATFWYSAARFIDCVFTDHDWRAVECVAWEEIDRVRFERCTFERNGADHPAIYGGALVLWGTSFDLIDCAFRENVGERGGALLLRQARGSIDRCEFGHNVANFDGGAIEIESGSDATNIRDTSFCGNEAPTNPDIGSEWAIWTDLGGNTFTNVCPEDDLDGDGVADLTDNCPGIANPEQTDCDENGTGDACDIAEGAADINANGVLDACECLGDVLADGVVNGADLGAILAYWGPATSSEFSQACDIDRSGQIDGADLTIVLASWGACRAP